MRIVIALGGNALLRRDEALTEENQRKNIRIAAEALAPIALEHDLIISHGNGPQVGLLALQGAAYKPGEIYSLDILDAETEGMIGYMLEQELMNLLLAEKSCATLLTQIEVDSEDPAFDRPKKPIGPVYSEDDAKKLAKEHSWSIAPDGNHFRRVVVSPQPQRIIELNVIELLVQKGVVVICAGGGGIPVVRKKDGSLFGVEAVIDKDSASALLARELEADVFLMLTDVDAVYEDWPGKQARAIQYASPGAMSKFVFAPGSMAPKVEAACEFAEKTGGFAGIGQLKDASAILARQAGTIIDRDVSGICWKG